VVVGRYEIRATTTYTHVLNRGGHGKGVPLWITPAGANLNDFKLCRDTIESIPIKRPEPTLEQPQKLCLDKGYDYAEVRGLAEEFGFTAQIRGRKRRSADAQT
jgi:hypothetical protein